MDTNEKAELRLRRDFKVIKANAIIQRARYDLNIRELKVLAFLFSMIKPTDPPGTAYTFQASDFCRVSGINYRSGTYYSEIKKTLKGLGDKSFWAMDEKGNEVLLRWVEKVKVSRNKSKITVKFDEVIDKYIHGLFENFTEYALLSTLPMRSAYSFRMYEILKSYAFKHHRRFELDDLKRQLMAETYENFKDFRKKVLEVSLGEINAYTDLAVNYEVVKKGNKVIALEFYIAQRDIFDYAIARQKINEALDEGQQLTIFDFMAETEDKE